MVIVRFALTKRVLHNQGRFDLEGDVSIHAVLLAGGEGSRFGGNRPKQLANLSGKPVMWWTCKTFIANRSIKSITVVVNPDFALESKAALADLLAENDIRFVIGGTSRLESSQKGIAGLPFDSRVIIHDATRPLLSPKLLEKVIETLENEEAVDVCIPSSDTIVQIAQGYIQSIPNRDEMRRGQTPQGFSVKVLADAWEKFLLLPDPKPTLTCDCSLVKFVYPNVAIKEVLGEEDNLKITVPSDLDIAERILEKIRPTIRNDKSTPNINLEQEDNLYGKVCVVIGGGTGIGEEIAKQILAAGGTSIVTSRRFGTDASNWKSLEVKMAQIYEDYKRIDHIIVTSGFLLKTDFSNMEDTQFVESIDSNLVAHINAARIGYKFLVETKGSLLLFSSSSFSTARPGYVLYSAMKSAVVSLAQGLASEWDNSIRVNVVCPSRTNTTMRRSVFGDEPMDSLLTPEQVAEESIKLITSKRSGAILQVRLN